MLVIFGAFIVFTTVAEFGQKWCRSTFTYGQLPVSHVSKPAREKRGRGRPANEGQEAGDVIPLVVVEAGLAPDNRDYHGNFNAEILETLFEALREDLPDRMYHPHGWS